MSKDNIKEQKKSKQESKKKEEAPPVANIPGFGLIISLSKYKEIRWGLFVVLVAVAYVLATNPEIVAGWFGEKEPVVEEVVEEGVSKSSQKKIEEKILNELLDGSPEDVWKDEEEEMVFE